MLTRRALARRSALVVAATTAAVTAGALTFGASAGAATGRSPATHTAAGAAGSGLYIVQMVGDPLATAASTKPAKGHKLDPRSATARSLSSQLQSRQDSALSRAGVSSSKVLRHYTSALNGVAVDLTADQAATLAKSSSVLQMWKNRILTVASTPPTPKFLGLTGQGGVWAMQFGSDANAGKGIIIGDIDTGFWPESPSFAALPSPSSDDAAIAAKWHGTCVAGDDHPVTCNNKVIGARWYNASGLASANPGEFHSPRDYDGHGSHTASTAAGDHVKNATVNGVNVGDLEGVAPAARIAVYKVLYENAAGTTSSGGAVDIVSAINDAVNDGVDVINFSVGDNVDSFGPEELAFLNAAAAGVFVSAAAGNAGPGAKTVDNAMPWETTVAAGTFDQSYSKSVTLGNGATYTGVGVGAAVPSSPLVDSATAALAGHTTSDASICVIGSLDPAKVSGSIVLCARGVNNRTDKSKAVQQAGGVGVVLYNPSPNSLNADFHFVPTVHVDTAAGSAIKAYIAGTPSPTASLSVGTPVTVEAPAVASFSSRGPSPSSGGDLLKPDIMAPGNDVVAAVSPANHSGNLYDTESGTSMSAPHIAGVAALLLSKHPDWPPMWVKSVIMTGAKTVDNAGNPIQGAAGNATPFDMGSGEVLPSASFKTELVFDSNVINWLSYSCSIGVHLLSGGGDVCDQVPAIRTSDLNYPSIAFGALAGTQSAVRTVTNVTGAKVVYQARVTAPAGFTATVVPNRLVVPAHGTASFTVTVTRGSAATGAYSFGDVRLKNGSLVMRMPVAVQAVPLAAPAAVSGTGTSGSTALTLQPGYTGTLTAGVAGLVPATTDTHSLQVSAGFSTTAPAAGPGTSKVTITIPAGTTLGRVRTFASDYPAGTDVDLYVFNAGTATLAGISASGSADEVVTLGPGTYDAYVDLFAAPSAPLNVTSYTWAVPPTAAGNLTATPASQPVTTGVPTTVNLSWTGLTAGSHYLGAVSYGDGSTTIGRTIVSVDP